MEVVVFDQSSIAIAIACIYYISSFLLLIYVSVPYTNHESIIHYISTPGVVQIEFLGGWKWKWEGVGGLRGRMGVRTFAEVEARGGSGSM